ncbi:MAG TPA: oxidoreductase, partial [Lysinibacillus sp.]|nr:oxidoreductase [Lysinibacillus sp.]
MFTMTIGSFKALVVNQEEEFTVKVNELTLADLPQGEVLIKIHYSSIN